MTEDQIKATIVEVLHRIAPDADPASLAPDDDLRQTLDIDSFDLLNFLIGLHERLGVDIPEKDYGKLRTLRAIIDYLSAKIT